MLRKFVPSLLILSFGIVTPLPLHALQDRILHFDSHLTVHPDSSLTVRESIKLQSGGEWLKEGFKYYFQNRTIGRWGIIHRAGFSLIEVLRDGTPEDCPVEEVSKGVQVHVGKQGLSGPGVHTFTVTYRWSRQIRYLDDRDELSRAIAGSWGVPMDRVTATVALPPKASQHIVSYDGRIKPDGPGSKNLRVSLDPAGNIVYATNGPLAPSEWMDVAVSWRKGFVLEPTESTRIKDFFRDNLIVVLGFIGLVIVFLYYWVIWRRIGRDPEKEALYPIYRPPLNLSPALMRYIVRMGYDDKAFSSALLHLIVKGCLTIQKEDEIYTLVRNDLNPADLSREERRLLEVLFASEKKISLLPFNSERIRNASDSLRKDLRMLAEKVYFNVNKRYVIPGLALSFLGLTTMLLSGETGMGSVMGFLVVGAPILAVLLYLGIALWTEILKTRKGKLKPFYGGLLISVFAFAFLWLGIREVLWEISPLFAILTVAVPAINGLFYYLLRAPTRAGRSLLNQIEGFKLFLNATEKDRFKVLHPMGDIPERFEKYLPYALALEIEQPWAELFTENVMEATLVKKNSSRR